jgi:glycosyltransferase involved in cell wall biosynthesis
VSAPAPPELLVLAPDTEPPFIKRDVAWLGRRFSTELIARSSFSSKVAFLLYLRRRLARSGDQVVLLWFLHPHYALESIALAHRYGSPVVVIVGGLEVDYIPALQLGGLKWPHNKLRQKLGLRAADVVVCPSEFLAERTRALGSPRLLEVIANGVDVDVFTPNGAREDLVVTVCFEINRENALLKGLSTFVETAALLPRARFLVVGPASDDTLSELVSSASPNVSFAGRAYSQEELVAIYRRAKTYAQLSAYESFGVALAESMACGCAPVISGIPALREVTGGLGFEAAVGVPTAAARAIESALDAGDGFREQVRGRVVDNYSFAERGRRLEQLLERALGSSRVGAENARAS